MTGDETWVHHLKLESKRASIEWYHPISPHSKKFKSQQSAGKVMVNVFWDSVGVILVDFMSKGATINSDIYIDTLKKLKARLQRVRSALEMSKVLLQHDNARPHTSLKTHEVISSFGWTTILHLLYSLDMAHVKKENKIFDSKYIFLELDIFSFKDSGKVNKLSAKVNKINFFQYFVTLSNLHKH